MSRAGTRRIAAFVSALLAVSLVGAVPAASAAVSPQSTPPPERPVPVAGVDVEARGFGARVEWHDVSSDVDTVEVWRTHGDVTENLTPDGFQGRSYNDRTAVAGATYTYTVKVRSVRPEVETDAPNVSPGSRRVAPKPGSIIGSDEVTLPAAEAGAAPTSAANGKAAAKARAAAAAEGRPNWRDVIPGGAKAVQAAKVSSKGVRPASHSGACNIDGGGTAVTLGAGTTTWSPATCPEGYQVNADVVVPAGSTLVVAPGTVVYFNLGSTGDDADGLTGEVDLLIEGGTLVADGASGSPVTFTSLDEHPIDSTGTPALGDWGVIAAFAGSTVTFDNVAARFGTGVAFIEIAPAVTASTIEQMSGALAGMPYRIADGYTYPTILEYYNPPGFSVPMVSGSAIRGHDSTYGLTVFSPDEAINTFGVQVTGSTLSSAIGLLALDVGDGDTKIDLQLSGNTITSLGSGYGTLVLPISEDGADANATSGNALVTGLVSGNTLASDTGYGFFNGAIAEDGNATHLLNYMGNNVRSYYYSSYNVAESDGGDATIAYGVTGGTYRAQSYEAWYDEATSNDSDAGADPGSATVALGFNGVNLESIDEGALGVYAYANEGSSAVDVDVQSSNFRSYGDAIYTEAYNDAGDDNGDTTDDYTSATNNLTVENTNLHSNDDEAIDMYAYSGYGSTLLEPEVIDSNLFGKYGALYLYSYGYDVDESGAGGTTIVPMISGSLLDGSDDDVLEIYGWRYTEGVVDASPMVVDSLLVSGEDDGIDVDTYADDGTLAIVPTVSNSTINVADGGLYLYGYNYGGNLAHATPYILNSVITGGDDEALETDIYAYEPGSAAKSLPYVVNSQLSSTEDDDGGYFYSQSDDGFTQSGGTFIGSGIAANESGAYFEAYRYNTAVDGPGSLVDPIFNNMAINAANDQAIEAYAYNRAGSASSVPAVFNSSLLAPQDRGVDAEAEGQSNAAGSYIYAGPTVSNTVIDSGDGVEIDAYDIYNGGAHQALVHAGGSIIGGSIFADWDYGVDGVATAWESTVGSLVDTSVLNTPVSSYDGIGFWANSYGCAETGACSSTDPVTGGATARPRVQFTQPTVVEAWWDYAVEVGAWSYYNGGPAVTDPEVRGGSLQSAYGVYLWSQAYENASTLSGAVVDNHVAPYAASDGDGIELWAGGGSGFTTLINSVVAGNRVVDPSDDGISAYAGAPSSDEDFNLVIAGNTVSNTGDDGIDVYSGGNTDVDDVVHIVRNVVDRTQSAGIRVDDVMADIRSNDQSNSGWQTSSSSQDDHSGIVVENQPDVGGLVACNTIALNSAGISYFGNPEDGDPATNENNFKDQSGKTNRPLNLSTDNIGTTDATGNWWGVTGTAIGDTVDGTDVTTTPARDDTACRGGYELDGFGAAHPYGPGTAAVTSGPYFGFDIANAIAVRGDGASGYVLDGYGGVHSFNGAPTLGGGPYFGFDAARDIALREDGTSGYLLDAYGAVHPLGGAPSVAVTKYTAGQDLARRLVLRPDGKTGWVVFANGELAEFGPTGVVVPDATGPSFSGDVARDVVVNHEGRSGYVLDNRGALHPFSTAYGTAGPTISGPYFPYSAAKAATWFNNGARIVLDDRGGLHVSKSSTLPLNKPLPHPYFGFDIARDLEGRR